MNSIKVAFLDKFYVLIPNNVVVSLDELKSLKNVTILDVVMVHFLIMLLAEVVVVMVNDGFATCDCDIGFLVSFSISKSY
jgi:hypothetical protein